MPVMHQNVIVSETVAAGSISNTLLALLKLLQ
jgi:hypothetical protein